MIEQKTTSSELAALLEQHLEEIANSWAEKGYQIASFFPSEGWLDDLRASMTTGLRALIDVLTTGSCASLKTYLVDVSVTCLRSGFENCEATEAMLLCKDAVMAVIRREVVDTDTVWAMISELDTCLRLMVGHFNTLYIAETNRNLREQHEQIVSMLRIGAGDPESIDIDEVLRQVAEGIMAAVETDHCDFYLMDEAQNRLIPKCGVSKSPLSPEARQAFLSQPPDLTTDAFYRELVQRKQPLVAYNAQIDSRVNKEVVEAMGARSVLAVPLVANDRVFAVAATGTFQEYRTFTDEQIELAWDFARAATLVLENARLRQQNRQMAALEERERLAREIHDNLAQTLGILRLQASNIDDLVHRGQFEQAHIFLDEMKKTAAEAHVDAREAIFGLRHSASSASEFLPTLRTYLERFRATCGIEAQLVVRNETDLVLPGAAVIQLTRVIQEALTNVRKHARAHAAWVRLEQDDGQLSVMIEDDGEGFDLAEVSRKASGGVGLQIMRERAESLGGVLHIDTEPGKGTRIVAQIPLSSRN